jgi:Phosphotransferase enzyme family
MPYQDWAIIPHPNMAQLLLLPSADGWALPLAEHAERHFWQSVAPVNQAIGALLAIDVTTLYCIQTDYRNTVYAMENHSPDWNPPPGAIWADRTALGTLELAQPEHRPLLERWFARRDAAAPANRPPWYQPGWFVRASEWALEQLERMGMAAIGPVEQLRSWERSTILGVPTTHNTVYFKAVPAMFAHEPALTLALAARDPAHFPAVLAADRERGWMLMLDAGSQRLDKVPDLGRWRAVLHAFAEMQIALASAASDLVRLGCPERPLDRLAAQIDGLLADTAALTPPGAALSDAEIATLRGRASELKAMCAELARAPIPPTLEHGDFWAGQVMLRGNEYIFIDWSDSSIAHPFFSMSFFSDTAEAEEFLPGVPDLRSQLRDAYLEPWAAYAPRAELIATFDMAQSFSALHNAMTYHQWILPHMESKWEMENMIPFYLRKLL